MKISLALGVRKFVLEELNFAKSTVLAFVNSDVLDLVKFGLLFLAKFVNFLVVIRFLYISPIPSIDLVLLLLLTFLFHLLYLILVLEESISVTPLIVWNNKMSGEAILLKFFVNLL